MTIFQKTTEVVTSNDSQIRFYSAARMKLENTCIHQKYVISNAVSQPYSTHRTGVVDIGQLILDRSFRISTGRCGDTR